MKYFLLDTSSLIEYLRGKDKMLQFFDSHKKDALISSTICEMEIFSGIYREKEDVIIQKKGDVDNLFSSLYAVVPFDREQANIAGRIQADLSQRGEKIEDMDVLIGAAALSYGAALVTYNPKHFQRIKELKVQSLL